MFVDILEQDWILPDSDFAPIPLTPHSLPPERAIPAWHNEFSEDPFLTCQMRPALHYLDPDREKLQKTSQYEKQNYNIYRAAWAIYNGLIEKESNPFDVLRPLHRGPATWGKNQIPDKKKGIKVWQTMIAGKKRQGRNDKCWFDKNMQLIDVINSMANPEKYAVGAVSAPGQAICQIRIDVDMKNWDETMCLDRSHIASELAIEHKILSDMGFHPHVFRTGRRGHQIVIPISENRNYDRVLQATQIIKRYLQAADDHRHDWRIDVDCDSLTKIMRLPLGRHALTGQVAWMLDWATGWHLPLAQQVDAVCAAFTRWSDDSIDLVFAYDATHALQAPPSACATVVAEEPVASARTIQPQSHADCDDDNRKIHVGAGWARKVIQRSFQPGGFFHWASNIDGGLNGIGAAIILYGIEVPKASKEERDQHVIARLSEYVCQVPGSSDDSHQDRIDYITWAVPENNIDAYYKKVKRPDCKMLDGQPDDENVRFGQTMAKMMVALQQTNKDIKPRAFTASATRTIEHVGALLHMMFASCEREELYTVTVSARSLSESVKANWPDDATNHMDVARQLEYLMEGEKCLLELIKIDSDRKYTSEATSYKKSIGWALVNVEVAKSVREDYIL